MPHIATPLLTLALVAPLVAQGADWSGGPVVGYAQGMSLDALSAVGGYDERSLVVTKTGFSRLPWPDWSPLPGIPDLTTLPWLSIAGLDIDALSMGIDWINADDVTGMLFVPPGNWGAITVSVTRNTEGQPGGLIAGEFLAPGGAAADIFGYVLPGSQGVPSNWIDRPMRTHDSREIGLEGPTLANVDAHDLYTGLLFSDAPGLIALLVPDTEFYFSVTFASLGNVPTSWWGGSPPSGAAVFVTTWSPTTSSWSAPTVAFEPTQLGLGNSEDLDGLALDLLRQRALISTTGAPVARDPLLFVSLPNPVVLTYRRPDMTPVSNRLGLRPGGIDDIDGICSLDPGNTPLDLRRARGYTQPPVFPGTPAELGINATSDVVGGNLITTMVGYPRPGPPLPGAAFVGVALGAPNSFYDLWSIFPRPTNPFPKYQGDPIRIDFPLPSDPGLVGLPVFFVWAAVDTGGIDVTPPVGVVLR